MKRKEITKKTTTFGKKLLICLFCFPSAVLNLEVARVVVLAVLMAVICECQRCNLFLVHSLQSFDK